MSLTKERIISGLEAVKAVRRDFSQYLDLDNEKKLLIQQKQNALKTIGNFMDRYSCVLDSIDTNFADVIKTVGIHVPERRPNVDNFSVSVFRSLIEDFGEKMRLIEKNGGTDEKTVDSFIDTFYKIKAMDSYMKNHGITKYEMAKSVEEQYTAALASINERISALTVRFKELIGWSDKDISEYNHHMNEANNIASLGFAFPKKVDPEIKIGKVVYSVSSLDIDVIRKLYPTIVCNSDSVFFPYFIEIGDGSKDIKTNIYIEFSEKEFPGSSKYAADCVHQLLLQMVSEHPIGGLSVNCADMTDMGNFTRFISTFDRFVNTVKNPEMLCKLRNAYCSKRANTLNMVDSMSETEFAVREENESAFYSGKEMTPAVYAYYQYSPEYNDRAKANIKRVFSNHCAQFGIYNIVVVNKDDIDKAESRIQSDVYTTSAEREWLETLKVIKEHSNCFTYCGNGQYNCITSDGRIIRATIGTFSADSGSEFVSVEMKIIESISNHPSINMKDIVSYEDIGFGSVTPEKEFSSVLSIPVGVNGDVPFNIIFNCGEEKDGPINVGYLAMGGSNSGKSSLFHGIIMNGAMKYSPQDLSFWLLDFKEGGAASNYMNASIPHVRLLAKENQKDDALCLFRMLETEASRRHNLINAAGQKVRGINFQNINEYNRYVAEHPEVGEHISRIVVMIDEAQEMFAPVGDEMSNTIGDLIGMIARTGRSVGIHLFLIVQNLSEGKTHSLNEHLLEHVKGRVSFNVAESALRASNFGELFTNAKEDLKVLRQGEALITNDNISLNKVRIAYSDNRNFDKYFAAIREKFGDFQVEMNVIGNKDPLFPEDMSVSSGASFGELIAEPTIREKDNIPSYSFVYGENAYNMLPAEFQLDGSVSFVCGIGSDKRIMSSLCKTVLIAAANIQESKIYVCNGAGTSDVIFNKAIEECSAARSDIRKFKVAQIDELLAEVYDIYLQRVRQKEAEELDCYFPVFVVINELSSMDKVRQNSHIASLRKQNVQTKIPGEDVPMENISQSLSTLALGTYYNDSQKTITFVIKEICENGSSVGIYLNFVSADINVLGVASPVIGKTKNLVVFNEYTSASGTMRAPEYLVKAFLDGLRNGNDKPETRVAAVSGITISKVRPVLY